VISPAIMDYYYPAEIYDGTRRFYAMIRAVLTPSMVVLSMGCGLPSRNPVKVLKGEVARLFGADIDPDAASNDEVDEVVIYEGVRFPFPDNMFDLVYCDYVMEHIQEPVDFLKELKRVLAPSGRFFFRTPNRRHYVPMMAAMMPKRWHDMAANRSRGFSEKENRTYRTFYAFNSKTQIMNAVEQAGFGNESLSMQWVECEPSYLKFSLPTFFLGLGYERLVNSTALLERFRSNIFGVIEKAK
jgi:SAM-dependent methyltransferase